MRIPRSDFRIASAGPKMAGTRLGSTAMPERHNAWACESSGYSGTALRRWCSCCPSPGSTTSCPPTSWATRRSRSARRLFRPYQAIIRRGADAPFGASALAAVGMEGSRPVPCQTLHMAASDVDSYLAGLDQARRDALQRLRHSILAMAPDAQEFVSYGMPAFQGPGQDRGRLRRIQEPSELSGAQRLRPSTLADELAG